MKIVTVVGARPQFIKAATVSHAFLEHDCIDEFVIHTGQHFDAGMSDIFFAELGIPMPGTRLDINGGSHGEMTGRMLIELDRVLIERRPDLVLVYGDTNSTLAGALSGAKLHLPIAHVEAGLRSLDMRMPEEINRIVTDQVSCYLFCPTRTAVANLEREGIADRNAMVLNTGDVMLDAALTFRTLARRPAQVTGDGFVLATIHREENTDDVARLKEIVDGLNAIHRRIAPVVMPLHPRTRKAILRTGLQLEVNVIDPVGYLSMLWLLEHSSAVVTDSGGLQKEAYFFARPCLTVRDSTEWVELLEHGANRLVAAESRAILHAAQDIENLDVAPDLSMFGDGQCSGRIAQFLSELDHHG
jgi:UDP-GlcNAc3NAcA epimerase